MALYEYFCPQCFRELEVLRPMEGPSVCRDCPSCGGQAWRLVSGFGSKTGSHLQPSGAPFRDEFGLGLLGSVAAATATLEDFAVDSLSEGQLAGVAIEVPRMAESQPNDSNARSINNWGIASILRFLDDDVDAEPASILRFLDEVTGPNAVEVVLDYPEVFDQPIGSPSVMPWPDEQTLEPAMVSESDARASQQPEATSTRYWRPTSYFGLFLLVAVLTAVLVVPLVWTAALAALSCFSPSLLVGAL